MVLFLIGIIGKYNTWILFRVIPPKNISFSQVCIFLIIIINIYCGIILMV